MIALEHHVVLLASLEMFSHFLLELNTDSHIGTMADCHLDSSYPNELDS